MFKAVYGFIIYRIVSDLKNNNTKTSKPRNNLMNEKIEKVDKLVLTFLLLEFVPEVFIPTQA